MKNKLKRILFTIAGVLFTVTIQSQQIGGGLASLIDDFTVPLNSGCYNGHNPIGTLPENNWQHLFVVRHPNGNNNYQLQIASSIASNDKLYFRKLASGTATPINPNWYELATRGTNNFIGNQTIDGSIGIGTTAPNSKLTIKSGNTGTGVSIHPRVDSSYFGTLAFNREAATGEIFDPTGQAFQINNGGADKNLHFQVYNNNGAQITDNALVISGTNANIGIGISNPSEKLEVYNSDTSPAVISLKSDRNDLQYVDVGRISAKQAAGEIARIGMPRSGGYFTGYLTFWTKADNTADLTEKVRIAENGNVGIGTINPVNKLDVNGTIHSREVKVDLTGWPDFVFKKEYNLPTLEEVEKHIVEKGHLENIPSEEDVLKNGINLGEMNTKLLQKIEELTLYTIEQNKKIQKLQEENKKFLDIEERLEKIERESK